MIANTSDLGWKVVSNLEGLEGQVGRISMVNLKAQEKAYLQNLAAMKSVHKTGTGSGAGALPSRGARARPNRVR